MASGSDSTQVPLPEDDNDFDCLDQQTLLVQAALVSLSSLFLPCCAANDVANDAESADYAENAEQAHGR